jgi:hypothetical protein
VELYGEKCEITRRASIGQFLNPSPPLPSPVVLFDFLPAVFENNFENLKAELSYSKYICYKFKIFI